MSRHPNQRSPGIFRRKAAVAAHVKGQMAEYEARAEALAADVEALERVQRSRPLKPPKRVIGQL